MSRVLQTRCWEGRCPSWQPGAIFSRFAHLAGSGEAGERSTLQARFTNRWRTKASASILMGVSAGSSCHKEHRAATGSALGPIGINRRGPYVREVLERNHLGAPSGVADVLGWDIAALLSPLARRLRSRSLEDQLSESLRKPCWTASSIIHCTYSHSDFDASAMGCARLVT